jgi:hypothetical protein
LWLFNPAPRSSSFAGAGDRGVTNLLRFAALAVTAGDGAVAGACVSVGAAV